MGGAVRILGAVAMVLGIGFDVAAMVTMWRAKANIFPNRAATALVTWGPFAISRNPIYLGNTLLVAGAAAVFANPWFVPAALLAAVLVWALAIRREEIHLAARFGTDWTAYARQTPRWVGFWRRRLPFSD